MIGFIIRRRNLILTDMGIIFLSFVMAGLIRFETISGVLDRFVQYDTLLWLSLLIRIPVYLTFGLYSRLWRYASWPDADRVIAAGVSGTALIYIANFVLLPGIGSQNADSHSIFFLDGLLNLLLLGSSRFGRRLYWRWQRYYRKSTVTSASERKINTLIVGADDTGELIVRHIKQNSESGTEVVGFVDANPAMHRMQIHSVPVLGGYEQIPHLLRQYKIGKVIVSNSDLLNGYAPELEHWCRSLNIPVDTAPAINKLFQASLHPSLLAQHEKDAKRSSVVFQNLLIAGGAGFIGANFVRYMLEAHPDYRIVVYDELTYAGNLDNLQGLADEYGERYVMIHGSICNPEKVADTMAHYQIDGVVNFAAQTHVDRSLMTPGSFAYTNVYGSCVLLEQARKAGVQRYHQISTDEVYGQIFHGSFKETDALDCRSPYSASKAGADAMTLAYFTSFDLPVTISRGSNTIGPYQHVEKVVPLFVTNALDNLPLPVYGDGLYERDYQFVRDHCQGIDLILHYGKPGEIYNLGSGREIAAINLAMKICDLIDKPYSLICFVEDRPGQDRRYSLDCTKVIALGWRPKHTTEQALEKTVQWFVENEWWWRKIKQGEYQEYYRRQYGERLKRSTQATNTVASVAA